MKDCEQALNLISKLESSKGPVQTQNLLDGEASIKLGLDDFDIVEKLGKGSFGAVYLVHRKNDPKKTKYAMKVLEKDKVLAQNLIRYAKTERNVLCLAKHQFIVGLEFAF